MSRGQYRGGRNLDAENNYKFGIFTEDYRVWGYDEQGKDIRFDPVIPCDPPNQYCWLNPSYAARFEMAEDFSNDDYGTNGDSVPMADLARGWIESGTSNGVVRSENGFDIGRALGSGIRDYMSQKISVDGLMTEDYTLAKVLTLDIPDATAGTETICKIVVSASSWSLVNNTVDVGAYVGRCTDDPESVENWMPVTASANAQWTKFDSGNLFTFSVIGAVPEVSLWLKINEGQDTALVIRIDDFFILAQDADGAWYPARISLQPMLPAADGGRADFGIKHRNSIAPSKFNNWYKGDFLLPEIIDAGEAPWAYGEYIEAASEGG
jgi:hypothetical protein